MKSSHFISRKNFYILRVINSLFKPMACLVDILGLFKTKNVRAGRLLLIGPTHIGDIMTATPAIRYAKQSNPEIEIICIASTSSREIIRDNPYVSGIEVIDLPWFDESHAGFLRSVWIYFSWIVLIKKVQAETAINFSSTAYHREHLAMWLAGIPRRFGFAHKGFGYLLTDEVSFVEGELIARQKLRLMKACLENKSSDESLKPDIFIPKIDEENAEKIYRQLGIKPGMPVIGINPVARHKFLWSDEYFIELCKILFAEWQANIVFLGGIDSATVVEKIRASLGFKTYSITGRTSLKELAAILQKVDLLITIDTGVRHIANAIGVKSIVLRHAADRIHEYEKYVATENVLHALPPCSPCGKAVCPLGTLDCMINITPKIVMNAVTNILGKEGSPQNV